MTSERVLLDHLDSYLPKPALQPHFWNIAIQHAFYRLWLRLCSLFVKVTICSRPLPWQLAATKRFGLQRGSYWLLDYQLYGVLTADIAKLQLRGKNWPLLSEVDAHGRPPRDEALTESQLQVDDDSGTRKDDGLWELPYCSLDCGEGDDFAPRRRPDCGSLNMDSTLLERWQNSDQLPRTTTDKMKSCRGKQRM